MFDLRPTPDLLPTPDHRADRMRFGRVLRVLLWTAVIIVALFPYPVVVGR